MFKEDRKDVEDKLRSGRLPITIKTVDNVEHVCNRLNTERRLSVRMIGEALQMIKPPCANLLLSDAKCVFRNVFWNVFRMNLGFWNICSYWE